MKIFSRLSSLELIDLISLSRNRVIYAAPGIHKDVSDLIIQASMNLGKEKIITIVDSDSKVCRFGFGSLDALDNLHKFGIAIRKTKGLRIGVLIIDNRAWIFSPTALLIEDQFNKSFINAIEVTFDQGYELIRAISPDLANEKVNKTKPIPPEIGSENFIQKDLNNLKKDLTEIPPPKHFDFDRKVRIYNSHIQFVELSMQGLQLNRRTLTIPPKLLNVSKNKDAQEKLKATYNLINHNTKHSNYEIQNKLSEIRKIYLRSVGNRLGSVILKQKKDEFIKEIDKVRNSIEKLNIANSLEKELKKSKKELFKILLPGIISNPPNDLKGEILTKKPSKETATNYLNLELGKIIPSVDELVKNINLYCDFKDITFETLQDKDFQISIRKQFPHVPWPKPFEEYDAIPERKDLVIDVK